jgi:hypothetical protein
MEAQRLKKNLTHTEPAENQQKQRKNKGKP